MGKARLTLQDYVTMADSRGLVFTGRVAPTSVNTTTRWQCRLTGKQMNKKYVSVKQSTFGSIYQRNYEENLKMYRDLATRLGIEFVYQEGHESQDPRRKTPTQFFPATTKDVSFWKGPKGKVVGATYHQLAYGDRIPADIAKALGVDPRVGREEPA